MDEELLAFNEQAQQSVPMPSWLDSKFPVSKKEVNISDKYLIGIDVLKQGLYGQTPLVK